MSLNLTNLVVILLLKLLIFAAGLLGAGHWGAAGHGAYNYARSQNSSKFLKKKIQQVKREALFASLKFFKN